MNNKENGGTVYVDRHGDDDFKDVAILVQYYDICFFHNINIHGSYCGLFWYDVDDEFAIDDDDDDE